MDKERSDLAARSDISADSIERNNAGGPGNERFERAQARWLEDMRARGVKIVQVTYPRTANNDKELSVVRGELLEVSINFDIILESEPVKDWTDLSLIKRLMC